MSQQEYLYRCSSDGAVNNGLKQQCDFEFVFIEGDHHCPLCGSRLLRVPTGPSVSELLRRGQEEVERKKRENKE